MHFKMFAFKLTLYLYVSGFEQPMSLSIMLMVCRPISIWLLVCFWFFIVHRFMSVAHSVFSLCLRLIQSPAYFPELSLNFFFLEMGFVVLPLFLVVVFFSGCEMISWSVVGVA